MMMVAGVVAGGGACAAFATYKYVSRPIAHIETGAQRRALHPINEPLLESAAVVLRSPDFDVRRELKKIPSGSEIFVSVMTAKGQIPTHVLVFFHGYTSNSDLYLEYCSNFARAGALVVMVDVPGHGRSDGLLTYVRDWWVFIAQIWEVLDMVMPEVSAGKGGNTLKVFGCGVSLGGGITACLALQRPKFFAGVCLIAPMLFVADDVKPPQLVQTVLKSLVVPLIPSWPITPAKELEGLDFHDAEHGRAFTNKGNPLSMKGCKARLATAVQMGLVFPDWMAKHLEEMSTPFLVVHGQDDKICDPGMSQVLYDKARCKDKSLKMIPGAYHCELFCCLPGIEKSIGMQFAPEHKAFTQTAIDEISSFMAKRI